MPAWTPLFGIAAAVVTETGGVLSHCAIVAREYGIPAVVGAYGATDVIRTGQRISVNGSTGIITLDA
jgi:pyruvate,water dikinase